MDDFIKNIAEREYLNGLGLNLEKLMEHKDTRETEIAQLIVMQRLDSDFDKYHDVILDACASFEHQGFLWGFAVACKLMGKEVPV